MATDHDAVIDVLMDYFRRKGLNPVVSPGTHAGADLQVENPITKTIEHVEVELDASMSAKVFRGVELSKQMADDKGFKLRVWFVSSSDKHVTMFKNKKPAVIAAWVHAYRICDEGYLNSTFGS